MGVPRQQHRPPPLVDAVGQPCLRRLVATQLPDPAANKTSTTNASFTGTVSGALSFPQGFGTVSRLSGQLSGSVLVLSILRTGGSLQLVTLNPGSATDYNAGVAALQASACTNQQASASASASRTSRPEEPRRKRRSLLPQLQCRALTTTPRAPPAAPSTPWASRPRPPTRTSQRSTHPAAGSMTMRRHPPKPPPTLRGPKPKRRVRRPATGAVLGCSWSGQRRCRYRQPQQRRAGRPPYAEERPEFRPE
jgi:hypothetical protein